MKKILFALSAMLLLSSCGSEPFNGTVTPSTKISDLEGRPSIILFAGTFCPHCQNEVPKYEEQIWDVYKDEANLFIQVIDKKEFETTATQGFNFRFTYEALSKGESCGYVPSYIMLDSNAEPVMLSCGGERSLDELEEELKNQLGLNQPL